MYFQQTFMLVSQNLDKFVWSKLLLTNPLLDQVVHGTSFCEICLLIIKPLTYKDIGDIIMVIQKRTKIIFIVLQNNALLLLFPHVVFRVFRVPSLSRDRDYNVLCVFTCVRCGGDDLFWRFKDSRSNSFHVYPKRFYTFVQFVFISLCAS